MTNYRLTFGKRPPCIVKASNRADAITIASRQKRMRGETATDVRKDVNSCKKVQ